MSYVLIPSDAPVGGGGGGVGVDPEVANGIVYIGGSGPTSHANLTWSGTVLGANGTVRVADGTGTAPAVAFLNATGTGIALSGTSTLALCAGTSGSGQIVATLNNVIGLTMQGLPVNGSAASGGNLDLSSTTHATKGLTRVGGTTGLVYDETNKRLGINVAAPTGKVHVVAGSGGLFLVATDGLLTARRDENSGSSTVAQFGTATGDHGGFLYDHTNAILSLRANSGKSLAIRSDDVERMRFDTAGNIVPGTAALATDATNGFTYAITCAGTPTGAPAGSYTGRVPWLYDSTAHKIWVNSGGTWRATAALT